MDKYGFFNRNAQKTGGIAGFLHQIKRKDPSVMGVVLR